MILLFTIVALFITYVKANVVINEIMYNHIMGRNYDYVELFNNGDSDIDISEWSLEGFPYTFQKNRKISANDYIVIVSNSTWFKKYYKNVPEAKIFGDTTGSLNNGGENLRLITKSGLLISRVSFDDRAPWPELADGGGPSLELRCPTADLDDPFSWVASPPSVNIDPHQETSGTPAARNTYVGCPADSPELPSLLITEIMFKPVGEEGYDDSHEYLEIFNDGDTTVQLSNFRVASARGFLRFTFANSGQSTIRAGEHIILAKDPGQFAAVYPTVTAKVFGPFDGALGNGGDKVVLMDDNGFPIDTVTYDDKFPWPLAADSTGIDNDMLEYSQDPPIQADWSGKKYADFKFTGFSLQRRSRNVGSRADHLARWEAYIAAPGVATVDFDVNNNDPKTYIPVVSDLRARPADGSDVITADKDVEIRLDFTPDDSPLAFESVRLAYVLDDPIFGDVVTGGIGASGSSGTPIVTGAAADWTIVSGYVIDNSWLKGEGNAGQNKAEYTFNGSDNEYDISIQPVCESDGQSDYRVFVNDVERLSFKCPLGASGFDENPAFAQSFKRNLKKGDTIRVESDKDSGAFGRFSSVTFSPVITMGPMNDMRPTVNCAPDATRAARFTCLLPKQAAESIVRYVVLYKMTGQMDPMVEHSSPRASDPVRYHAYFVDPQWQSASPIYHFYINPSRWGQLQSEAEAGRCNGCEFRATWGHQVPGVLVHKGEVMDVMARFQGSRYNRKNGVGLSKTGFKHPPTSTMKAVSWRWSLPRYAKENPGGSVVILQKMYQGCTMYQTRLAYELVRAAGGVASTTRYVRTYVNGNYFRYMIQVERGGSAYVERFNSEYNERCIDHPREPVGDLFKSQGCGCNECGYTVGNLKVAPARCGFTSQQVLANTVGRKTHKFANESGHDELYQITLDLAAQNLEPAGHAACRTWFENTFDMDKLFTWIGVYNFAQAWDDNLHNFYPYRRLTDGKWFILPWDADRIFGERQGWASDKSIYIGEDSDPDTSQKPNHNRVKATVIRCAKSALQQKYHLLLNTVLDPAFSVPLFDAIDASFNRTEADLAWGSYSQNFGSCVNNIRKFLQDRPASVKSQLTVTAERTEFTEDDFCMGTPKITNRANNAYKGRPGRPTNLNTLSVTDNTIELRWTPPNRNGNILKSYTVQRRVRPSGAWEVAGVVQASSTGVPTFSDSGRSAETIYEYRIRALAVQSGAWSSTLRIATPKAGAQFQVPVVVNEIRANSGNERDFVELYNPVAVTADISGWKIVDDLSKLGTASAFTVPDGTTIPADGLLVFTEDDLGFRLAGSGESVYLVRTLADGTQTGYQSGFDYPPSVTGGTLGRYVLSTGEPVLLPEVEASPGEANKGAKVGPIVINKIMYSSKNLNGLEYITLKNIGDKDITLEDETDSTITWQIGGLGSYSVPQGTTIKAGEELYIANKPAAEVKTLLMDNSIDVLGPFSGSLSDNGERLTLRQPSTDVDAGQTVFATVETLRYSDSAPWPAGNANGNGGELVRLAPNAPNAAFAVASDPANWGLTVPSCSPTCKNSGICVRDDVCDCTDSNFTGPVCDSAPLSCGDNVVQADSGEQCDGGACCTEKCRFKAKDTTCRASVGSCDVEEVCDGVSAQCPSDSVVVAGRECRPAANGGCDVAEQCDGESGKCPDNAFAGKDVPCRAAKSDCDAVEFCPGNGAQCPKDDFAPSTQECRAAVGPCDEPEFCDKGNCPADGFKANSVECRKAAGPCDVAEFCTGSTAACPANEFLEDSFVCRNATGPCAQDTKCSGNAATCPATVFRGSGFPCRQAASNLPCDAIEFCSGESAECPPDIGKSADTSCEDNDACTTESFCQSKTVCAGRRDKCPCIIGNDVDCDDFNPCTIDECVAVAGGNTTTCAHTPGNAGSVCREAAGECDSPEMCTGLAAECPIDLFKSDIVCRNATAEVCDVAELCSGKSAFCPPDQFAGNDTVCRLAPADKPCDADDYCDGTSPQCPPDLLKPFGAVCREPVAACDRAETCDGVSDQCPEDVQKVNGDVCDDNDPCTPSTVCLDGKCSGARSVCNCESDADCDDGNSCTSERCEDRECKFDFLEKGDRCNDGDPCSINDRCTEAGRCEGRQFCENGSECLRPGPFCSCQSGWTGLRCETPLCEPACGAGGKCLEGNTCECKEGWKGDQCDEREQGVKETKKPLDLEDIKLDEFSWNQDLGGGLYGWTVAVIAGCFLLLCIISLAVVGFLLKHFIVDPVEAEVDFDGVL